MDMKKEHNLFILFIYALIIIIIIMLQAYVNQSFLQYLLVCNIILKVIFVKNVDRWLMYKILFILIHAHKLSVIFLNVKFALILFIVIYV